ERFADPPVDQVAVHWRFCSKDLREVVLERRSCLDVAELGEGVARSGVGRHVFDGPAGSCIEVNLLDLEMDRRWGRFQVRTRVTARDRGFYRLAQLARLVRTVAVPGDAPDPMNSPPETAQHSRPQTIAVASAGRRVVGRS